MTNELMPAKIEGYRPATVEEELSLVKSGSDLIHAANLMQLADARLLGLEEKKENLLRQLDDARKALAAAQLRNNATLDKLGLAVGDEKAVKHVDGVLYIRAVKKA